MKPFNECTPEEISDYNTAQQDTIDCHTRAIAKLRVRNQATNIEDDEKNENKEKIADLRADRGILRARRDAFYASRAQIEPPTEKQLSALKENLDAVNKLTVERRIAVKVTELATDALKTFSDIQPG